MSEDVYISFGFGQRRFVDRLVSALETIGLTVQHEDTFIRRPGAARDILEVSRYCSCLVACWSPATINCREVYREALDGLESNALVQVIVEPCRPPRRFAGLDASDLSSWTGNFDHPAFLELLQNMAVTEYGGYLNDFAVHAVAVARDRREAAATRRRAQ